MTSGIRVDAKKNPRSAVVLAITLIGIVSIEALYLQDLWKRDQESRWANNQLEAFNAQMQHHLAELRSAAQRINATFARLNDGVVRVAGIEERLPHRPNGISESTDSKVAKSLREEGLVVTPFRERRRETSLTFEVGSNKLELHRLIPLLAEQENSNAFLFIDKLNLVRPAEIPAFSMNPTELETRLLIRILSVSK